MNAVFCSELFIKSWGQSYKVKFYGIDPCKWEEKERRGDGLGGDLRLDLRLDPSSNKQNCKL